MQIVCGFVARGFVYSRPLFILFFHRFLVFGGLFMDIERSFPTSLPADQMKNVMLEHVLSRDDVKMFFGDVTWDGNTLNFTSGLVTEGKFEIVDNEVKVACDLSMFGKMAKGQIEGTLEKTFSKLPAAS
jgi:hypothetical protein